MSVCLHDPPAFAICHLCAEEQARERTALGRTLEDLKSDLVKSERPFVMVPPPGSFGMSDVPAGAPRIIGLGCEARVGKDTAAEYLARYGYTRIGFADSLKQAARAIFGFTDDQLYGDQKEVVDPFWGFTPRNALQRMGTEAMRATFGDDVWIRALENTVTSGGRFVITDCRFPNEAGAVKRWGGIAVRIVRPNGPGAQGGVAAHASETALHGWLGWDAKIVNDGTLEELYAKLDALLLGERQ